MTDTDTLALAVRLTELEMRLEDLATLVAAITATNKEDTP